MSLSDPVASNRIRIIQDIIDTYDFSTPFHIYLKACFRKNKAFGSSDRRLYRSWCYAWWRLGKALADLDFPERIWIANYLVNGINDSLSHKLFISDGSGNRIEPVIDSKPEVRIGYIRSLIPEFEVSSIINNLPELSDGINRNDYSISMLNQPDLFIRTKKKYFNQVVKELQASGIDFEIDDNTECCLTLKQSENLDKLKSSSKHYFEIQDRSSQIVAGMISASANDRIWDCCCGAGGKSLSLLDRYADIRITGTDIRESILDNFKARMDKSDIDRVELSMADISIESELEKVSDDFDIIVADVPCTGSGTWSRTPENLNSFTDEFLEKLVMLQRNIVVSTSRKLKHGGYFYYITCSVFITENEEQVEWIKSNTSLQYIDYQLINGINNRADSMFIARFRS